MYGELTKQLSEQIRAFEGKNTPPQIDSSKGLEPALRQAAANGELEKVWYLIEKQKVNIDAVGDSLNTALHFAAQGGHDLVVLYLLNKGASTVQNKKNHTPESLARAVGKTETANLLQQIREKNSAKMQTSKLIPLLAIPNPSTITCAMTLNDFKSGKTFEMPIAEVEKKCEIRWTETLLAAKEDIFVQAHSNIKKDATKEERRESDETEARLMKAPQGLVIIWDETSQPGGKFVMTKNAIPEGAFVSHYAGAVMPSCKTTSGYAFEMDGDLSYMIDAANCGNIPHFLHICLTR